LWLTHLPEIATLVISTTIRLQMTRIIGIDPGSRRTGYGIIDITGSNISYVSSGIIRLPEGGLPSRLKLIFDGISQLLDQYQPETMAVEDVFFARDPKAALKLGQARGAAIVAGVNAQLPLSEYSARSVKQAVVGTGAADKKQVQMMVTSLLKLAEAPAEDAADALAVAICHGHSMRTEKLLANHGLNNYARGRHR